MHCIQGLELLQNFAEVGINSLQSSSSSRLYNLKLYTPQHILSYLTRPTADSPFHSLPTKSKEV